MAEIEQSHTPSKIIAASQKIQKKTYPKIEKLFEYMDTQNLTPIDIIYLCERSNSLKTANPSKSLRFLVENKLSYRQYVSIRKEIKNSGHNYLVPYYKLHIEKISCLPQSSITSDCFFTVDALDAVCTSVKRLFESDFEYFNQYSNIIVNIKIGVDGARTNTNYAHFFSQNITDQQFILASFSILDISNQNLKIFVNPKPCSDRYTRPLYFAFEPENSENVIGIKSTT